MRKRDIKVLREKRSLTGDVLALTVSLLPPGHDHARSRFRITKRPGGADGVEAVLLSEDFYAIAQLDVEGYLEVVFDGVLAKFETAFENEAARMDADDAADAVDKILQRYTRTLKKG